MGVAIFVPTPILYLDVFNCVCVEEVIGLCGASQQRCCLALELLESMLQRALQPNLITFTAGAEACHLAGNYSALLGLLRGTGRCVANLLCKRHGRWTFQEQHVNHPGNAVVAFDLLYSLGPPMPYLNLGFAGSMYRELLTCLKKANVKTRSKGQWRLQDAVLERQFFLGMLFTAPALSELGFSSHHSVRKSPTTSSPKEVRALVSFGFAASCTSILPT